jgi:GH43 family beta-xylosidase
MTYDISRRSVIRGGLSVAAATALVASTTETSVAANSPGNLGATDAQIYGVPTLSPLVLQRADPFITKPVNGVYYMTGSVPAYDRLVVRGAATIAGLATAAESTVWTRPSVGKMGGHIWAPELHRFDGRWYIYFAAGDSDDVFRIRMYVMESTLEDPRVAAGWGAPQQIRTPWESFSLDATTFEHLGRRYLVWAQSEPEIAVNTSLYIAEMSSPWAISTFPARIATPTRPWETQGFKVNEGASVIVRNGRVFMTFSASATDARYCMGLLTASADADLLDPASWTKSPEPVFVTSAETGQYGPGHNSFTVAEDGVTDVLVYHARDYREISGDPLYDPNRHTRVQKLYWHSDGTPLFGVPVGKGGPIVRLSPVDAPSAYIRHDEFVCRVEEDVRKLADSQFRFVPGLAGSGSESLQSVNYPDRYLHVVGHQVFVQPWDGTAGSAGQASFMRKPERKGIALQLAADPASYLRHDRGSLTVGAAAGSRTTFVRS